MNGKKSNPLVKGALILTIAGVLSKILSAGYRIPLQNITGDIGFYIYQQVYPILGMAMMLALYGFPSAISKLGADIQAKGENVSFRHFYVPLFFILLTINGIIFIILFSSAEILATYIGDEQLYPIYQLTAFVFLLVPFLALLRGGFQASGDMHPTAISQIGEQLIRVSIIICAAVYISFYGMDLYMVGYAAIYASFAGGIVASIILIWFWFKKKPTYHIGGSLVPWKPYIKTVFIFGMVASLNHMILLLIQVVDVFTLVPSLVEYGYTQEQAKKWKGIFDRGYPLVQFGTVLGSSFSLAIIPTLSKQKSNKNVHILSDLQSAIRMSFYIASGAMIGLIVIFPEVNILLFQDDYGTTSLQILACSILLSSLTITSVTILQGIGDVKKSAFLIGIALLLKWYLNVFLVSHWGITGSALATIFSLLALCILAIYILKRKLPLFSLFKSIHWQAFFMASISMIVFLLGMKWILPATITLSRLSLLMMTLFIVVIGGSLYLFILIRCHAFTKQEISVLPFLDKLSRWMKGEHRDE